MTEEKHILAYKEDDTTINWQTERPWPGKSSATGATHILSIHIHYAPSSSSPASSSITSPIIGKRRSWPSPSFSVTSVAARFHLVTASAKSQCRMGVPNDDQPDGSEYIQQLILELRRGSCEDDVLE